MGRKPKKKSKSYVFKLPKNQESPTLEEFTLMVDAHDPTHIWSRVPSERERGRFERSHIDRARASIGDSLCVPIWNRAIYKKVVPSMVSEFLWKCADKNKTA